MRILQTWIVGLAVSILLSAAQAGDWPMFRGPNAAGLGQDGVGLPVEWSESRNVEWKIAVPGRAWSAPIVVGDRVIVTTAVTDAPLEEPKKGLYFGGNRTDPQQSLYRWQVHCYDVRSGEQQWSAVAAEHKPATAIHLKNTYASETPVSDGKHIWAYFGSAGLYCYDMDGRLVWKKDLGAFRTRYGWGTASSPIIDDRHVYIQADNEDQSFVIALDKRSGEQVWRADREEGSNWSTPFLWRTPQSTELITCGSDWVRSYDPATGALLWKLRGMSNIAIPTPLAAHGLLYISSGYVGDRNQRPVFAIRPGATGDISLADGQSSNKFVVWYERFAGPYNPSPIIVGDYLYVLYDRGIFACHDAQTGREIYKNRIAAGVGQFTASPWSYDGRIFCLNESGQTYVIPTGPRFSIERINTLDDEMFMATPAIAGDRLLIRGMNYLYCVRTPRL